MLRNTICFRRFTLHKEMMAYVDWGRSIFYSSDGFFDGHNIWLPATHMLGSNILYNQSALVFFLEICLYCVVFALELYSLQISRRQAFPLITMNMICLLSKLSTRHNFNHYLFLRNVYLNRCVSSLVFNVRSYTISVTESAFVMFIGFQILVWAIKLR